MGMVQSLKTGSDKFEWSAISTGNLHNIYNCFKSHRNTYIQRSWNLWVLRLVKIGKLNETYLNGGGWIEGIIQPTIILPGIWVGLKGIIQPTIILPGLWGGLKGITQPTFILPGIWVGLKGSHSQPLSSLVYGGD